MASLRLRLTAGNDDTNRLINQLAALPDIDSVEEIADLMPHMDDEDSNSAGLPDDMGPGSHLVLVTANDQEAADQALEVAKDCARTMGIALELESDTLPPG